MGLSSLVAAPFELVVAIIFLYQYVSSLCYLSKVHSLISRFFLQIIRLDLYCWIISYGYFLTFESYASHSTSEGKLFFISSFSLVLSNEISNQQMHRAVLASRDKRMDVLNEFIQAIRFVKYSASEGQWLDRVFTARTYELSQLLRTRMNNLMIGVRCSSSFSFLDFGLILRLR